LRETHPICHLPSAISYLPLMQTLCGSFLLFVKQGQRVPWSQRSQARNARIAAA